MNGVLSVPTSVPSHAAASSGANTVKASGGGIPANAPGGSKPADRSPAQKVRDEKSKAVRAGNRFDSFAPERSGNTVKWYASVTEVSQCHSPFRYCRYVDGRDFMWAISELM
jgi:hypothetical protein